MSVQHSRQPTTRRVLVGSAVAYLANAVPAAWISVRDDLPGEPFGIRTGLDARGDLVCGFGTALCAPPPMLLGLAMTAARVREMRAGDRRRVAVITALGAAFLVGMLAEPVTREVLDDPRAWPVRTAIVIANLGLPAIMVAAGLRDLAITRGS